MYPTPSMLLRCRVRRTGRSRSRPGSGSTGGALPRPYQVLVTAPPLDQRQEWVGGDEPAVGDRLEGAGSLAPGKDMDRLVIVAVRHSGPVVGRESRVPEGGGDSEGAHLGEPPGRAGIWPRQRLP